MRKIGIEIKWGIIFTLCALLWMVFEKTMGWHDENIADHATYTNLFSIIAVLVFIVAVFDKRKNYYNGRITWLQGFVSGIFITLVVVILTPLSQWITLEWITPEYFDNAIKYAVENNKMTEVEAKDFFNMNSYITQAMIGGLIMGVVTSAITGAIGLIGNKK